MTPVAHRPWTGRKGVRALLIALGLLSLCLPARQVSAQPDVQAYIIKLDGMITSAYAEAIKRKVLFAQEQGVQTVILEMDTPGGEVGASIDLGRFIFTQDETRIIAYINTDAYSGGTMVALACDEIYIDSDLGVMGDVAPIGISGEEAGEKIQSPIRTEMANYARKRGYPVALVKAMVTKELEVYRIKMLDDPEPRFVTGTEIDAMTDQERAKIDQRELIVAPGELLTMSAKQAEEYGFAKTVQSRQALFDALKLEPSRVKRLYLTGSERALTFLDAFSPLLIVAGVILLFIEVSHPGFGLPGILGIACFAVLFIVKYTLHYARLFEIVLFGIALVLLLMEVFVTPGFGLLGAAGIILLFASLVLVFQQFDIPQTPSEGTAFQLNVLKVLASFAAAGIGVLILARYLPSLPILGRIVHRSDLAAATIGAALEERTPGFAEMVGQTGVALTPLRPSGRAEFGDRLLHVVTEGDFVEKGTPIRIAAIHGNRVIVQPHREA